MFLNHTYTESSRTDRYNWAYDPDPDHVYTFTGLPFVQQPAHSGTAALTYNKYDIDATLAYGYQSRALSLFQPRGLSVYSEGVQTLDFRAEYYLRPRFGVYAVRGLLPGGRVANGVANLGTRPMFEPPKELLEPYFFDFSGDLYGQEIEVAFHRFLRPEAKFGSLEALQAQMARDCDEARALLG